MTHPEPLEPQDLRVRCDPETLGIETTADVEPLEGMLGQDRAVAALQLGLGVRQAGYNVFVSGPPGIGKMTAVQPFLEELARERPAPWDWCYVNNFADPYRPAVCRLPAGQGRQLEQDMEEVIHQARHAIPKAFESEDYGNQRAEIGDEIDARRKVILKELAEEASAASFTLKFTPVGLIMIPTLGERPLTDAEVNALPESAQKEFEQKRSGLEKKAKDTIKVLRELERESRDKRRELDRQVALFVVGGLIDDLLEKYADEQDVCDFLEGVKQDVLENIDAFRESDDDDDGEEPGEVALGQFAGIKAPPWLDDLPFRNYRVNVLVDRSEQQGNPVVVELNPSYHDLFGRIEKETQFGITHTDFTMIKAGAVHEANGGYLVLQVEELLRNSFSWSALKRAIKGEEILIEDPAERMGLASSQGMRPQAIPLELKVVLVGDPYFYHLLHAVDNDFASLFKVRADFDTRMKRSEENVRGLVRFVRTLCDKEDLLPFDAAATAAFVEHAVRAADDQRQLSTRFGQLADVLREASYWASGAGLSLVGRPELLKALDEKVYRSNLIEIRLRELTEQGTILIDTAGEVVGQVNGLSVARVGDYEFGRPCRITATVGPGRGGIVDIEREVELAGPIHGKGVLILGGCVSERYARERPLTLTARLVFEQSYGLVEGDSASLAEACALLSAIARIPLRQSLALTGSINQHGQVQAIGGVNHKIEGFFDTCRVSGSEGPHGVLIPKSNARHLQLREDVVEAVAAGSFRVYAVETLDEALEVLTGRSAGVRDARGVHPEGSFNHEVDRRLEELARVVQTYSAPRTGPGVRHLELPAGRLEGQEPSA